MPEVKSKKKFLLVLLRDAFFCATFIYLVLQALQLVPLNARWFQPASSAFKDFDWSDIYFSKIKNLNSGSAQNENIIVINIGNANREEIANTLIKLNTALPKVLGLDILFHGSKDSYTDALLDSAIQLFGKRIVIGCYADSTSGNSIYSLQPLAVPKLFDEDNLGYVNFVGMENATVRSYYKIQEFRNRKLASFAFNVFMKFNDEGNLNSYKGQQGTDESIIPFQSKAAHYTTISYTEILDSSVDFELLKNKIVLLGYGGSNDGTTVIDDKHFTPLNENYAGKALPDMFGIYIHANIVEGYIDHSKILAPPRGLQILICIIIISFFLILYLYSESKDLVWQSVIELLLQLFLAFVIIILAIYFLSSYGIKWNIGEMIAAVALAEPLVGVYKVLIHYLGKIYSFTSIYKDDD